MENALESTMHKKIIATQSEAETKKAATALAQHLSAGDVVLLKGNLGAGKTQFTQGLALGLGVSECVVSPTFNILCEYRSGHTPLFHFDLYRLDFDDQLEDIAFFETVEGAGVSVIEWWDKFPDCMPSERLEIEIIPKSENSREIVARAQGTHYQEILKKWEFL